MIDFPASPTVGQIFTSAGASWKWDGVKWVAATAPGPAVITNDVGRNLVHNPLFNIGQRGAGPFSINNTYTLDRWHLIVGTGNANTIAQNAQTDTTRAQIGDEAASFMLSSTFTGAGGANGFTSINQLIEGVRRLAGKIVTLSFWAAASAALKLGVSIDQGFGTGGSPSAAVTGTGQSVTLTGSFVRYSLTFTVPSVAGKTLGTNGDDFSTVIFWYSADVPTLGTRSGNVGVQSGSINLWGVQLEIGSAATPLEKPDPQQDLAKCQRFYQTGTTGMWGYIAVAGVNYGYIQQFPVVMRATPTIVMANPASYNLTGVNSSGQGPYAIYSGGTTSNLGSTVVQFDWSASADL